MGQDSVRWTGVGWCTLPIHGIGFGFDQGFLCALPRPRTPRRLRGASATPGAPSGVSARPPTPTLETPTRPSPAVGPPTAAKLGAAPCFGAASTGGAAGSRIEWRVRQAGGRAKFCAHSFRVTEITEHLRNGCDREVAGRITAHRSTHKMQIFNRLHEEIPLAEFERIHI